MKQGTRKALVIFLFSSVVGSAQVGSIDSSFSTILEVPKRSFSEAISRINKKMSGATSSNEMVDHVAGESDPFGGSQSYENPFASPQQLASKNSYPCATGSCITWLKQLIAHSVALTAGVATYFGIKKVSCVVRKAHKKTQYAVGGLAAIGLALTAKVSGAQIAALSSSHRSIFFAAFVGIFGAAGCDYMRNKLPHTVKTKTK